LFAQRLKDVDPAKAFFRTRFRTAMAGRRRLLLLQPAAALRTGGTAAATAASFQRGGADAHGLSAAFSFFDEASATP